MTLFYESARTGLTLMAVSEVYITSGSENILNNIVFESLANKRYVILEDISPAESRILLNEMYTNSRLDITDKAIIEGRHNSEVLI